MARRSCDGGCRRRKHTVTEACYSCLFPRPRPAKWLRRRRRLRSIPSRSKGKWLRSCRPVDRQRHRHARRPSACGAIAESAGSIRKAFPVYNFAVEGDHTYFVGTANGGTWVHNRYGMLGNPATQNLEKAIAKDLESAGWEITHGAGKPQEKILDPAWQPNGLRGRRKGTVLPDISVTKNGVTMRIQTADTLKNGQMTPRELSNFNKIRQRRPGDLVYWFPKDGGW